MAERTHHEERTMDVYSDGRYETLNAEAGSLHADPVFENSDSSKAAQQLGNLVMPTAPCLRGRHALTDPESGNFGSFAPYSSQPGNLVTQSVDISHTPKAVQQESAVKLQHSYSDSPTYEKFGGRTMSTSAEKHSPLQSLGTSPASCSPVVDKDTHHLYEEEGVTSYVQAPDGADMGVENTPLEKGFPSGESDRNISDGHVSDNVVGETKKYQRVPATSGNDPLTPAATLSEGSRSSMTGSPGRGPLSPQNGNARICKSINSTRNVRSHQPDVVLTPSRTPTEEDLLLLLMRRQRIRDQAHNRLAANLNQLQAENRRLKDQGVEQAARLESAEKRWSDVVRQGNVREADVKRFKEKYDKLKVWALEMHEEYAAVRAEGTQIGTELSNLKAERQAELDERAEILDDLEKVWQPPAKHKEVVAELRETSAELQSTRLSLKQAREQVREAKSENKTYALYIEKLEGNQKSMNLKHLEGQREIKIEIAQVISQLRKHDANLVRESMAKLTNVLHELLGKTSSKSEISTHFSSLLVDAEEKYAKLSTEIANIGQAQAEHHIVHELQETIQQLKTEHAAALAGIPAEIQREADKKLANHEESMKEKEERCRAALQEKTNTEADLANLRRDFEAKERELTAEMKISNLLRDQKQELINDLKEAQEKLDQYSDSQTETQSCKQAAEKVRDALQVQLRACEIEMEKYNNGVEKDDRARGSLQEQISKLTQTCNQNKTTEIQLSDALKHAEVEKKEILKLKKSEEAALAKMRQLEDDLKSARSLAQHIPRLGEQMTKQDEELGRVRQALPERHRESEDAQAQNLEQNRLIEELQKEKASINDELKRLKSAHAECGRKDQEMDVLQEKITKLEQERTPRSKLNERLIDKEKLALTEEVIELLKSAVDSQDEHLHKSSHDDERTSDRPRRAANRSAYSNTREVVVPDSQGRGHVAQERYHSDTSDLSEPSDELEKFINEDSDYAGPYSFSSADRAINVGNGHEIRPGTANYEMLLRSSNDSGYPPTSQTQEALLAQAIAPEISPMRTRGGSQIRHGTPTPQTGVDGERVVNFMSPPPNLRESHVPNSAIKRRQTSEASEAAAKRRNVSMKDLEVHPSKSSAASPSTQTSNTNTAFDRPAGARTSSIGIIMPAPGKTKKKATNCTRSTNKSNRMQAQFSG